MVIATTAISQAQEKEPERAVIDKLTDSVMAEGKALFRSEWASWHGTDVFLEKFKARQSQIGGYVSYETATNLVNVFYTKGDKPLTMGVISFGKELNVKNYQIDTVPRQLNNIEEDLFSMRVSAAEALRTDTTFKRYDNISLNVVPFINKGVKRIYILSAPNTSGVILFGNDYLLNINSKNEVSSIKRIHNSLISTDTKKNDVKAIFHSHIPGKDETMSATDICTMMLYEKENNVKQAYVMSRKYVSIWDAKDDRLVVLSKQAWDRINNDQKTRHPDKL
jgi:hypothetical protein